ncbi:MAG: radical SAM protein [Candidatus Wallbacteria bacterium]
MDLKKHFIIPIFLSNAGCPSKKKCIFCNQHASGGDSVALTETDQFIRKYLYDISKNNNMNEHSFEIAFYGGTFTALEINIQSRLMEGALVALAEFGVPPSRFKGIRISTRPDFITDEILKNLKSHNVKTIEIGVESFNDRVLEYSNRNYTGKCAYNALKSIKANGFELSVHLMCGLPFQTREIFMGDIFKTLEIEPEYARIHPLCVIKGTELEKLLDEKRTELFTDDAELIKQTSLALCYLESGGIKVIRIGILENEKFRKEVISGPAYPNLREIVEGEIHEALFQLLRREAPEIKTFEIKTASEKIKNYIIGYKKENIKKNSDIFLEIKNNLLYNNCDIKYEDFPYIQITGIKPFEFLKIVNRLDILKEYINNT